MGESLKEEAIRKLQEDREQQEYWREVRIWRERLVARRRRLAWLYAIKRKWGRLCRTLRRKIG